MDNAQGVFIIAVITFILNLPFGYVRAFTRKYTLPWFFCIHAPIPFVAAVRIVTGVEWIYIPVFLLFAILGQIAGGKINKKAKA